MEARTPVVIVGAGPVGLLTALQLKRRGIDSVIIDESEPASARSFAVVLHPRTVAMLANLDLVDPLRWQGQSFRRVAVFAGGERRALLELPVDGEHADGALTLPQNVLRKALEHALATLGVDVTYGWRLASFEQNADEVHARFVHAKPSSGQSQRTVPADAGEFRIASAFLIGADGHQSTVREALGSALVEVGPARAFAFFDVPQPAPSGETAELVLGSRSAAVYPLHGGSTRYSFELDSPRSEPLGRAELHTLLDRHVPWHVKSAHGVEWSGVRTFNKALADRFGHGRVWLAGDACHQTSPLGAQSLNVGLREARDLASSVAECLDGRHLEHLAVGYAEQRRLEWRRLLACGIEPTRGKTMPGWADAHLAELIACLPASGDDLDDLLEQLGITLL
ncbi:MAG TPA: FAD-dependent oxidoreductase [Polyangiaceae bacterium]|nr:FAD-dependent oxidoreductase [Polyangiaceae bacterium]